MNTQTIAIIAPSVAIDEAAEANARQRGQIRAAWRQHAAARQSTAAQHAALALLLGISLDRAFTPITNPVKLANGMSPSAGRDTAVAQALSGSAEAWAPFAALLQGAASKEQWNRRYYDMASHALLRKAAETAKAQAS